MTSTMNEYQRKKYEEFHKKYLQINDDITKDIYELGIQLHKIYKFNSYYTSIIERTARLIKELNIKDPIQISIVFEYLLWNGYFSKNKKLIYSTVGKKDKFGAYGADIMLGRSSCFNNAEMLSLILSKLGYESHVMFCNLNPGKDLKKLYTPEIKTKKSKLNYLFPDYLFKKSCNHAFTLIKDNKKHFICDPTNLDFLVFSDFLKAKYVCNNISVDIVPFTTLSYEYIDKDTIYNIVLESFKNINENTINVQEIKKITEETLKICQKNTDLLNDFYNENKSDIKNICKKI